MIYTAESSANQVAHAELTDEIRQLRAELADTQRRLAERTEEADSLCRLVKGRGEFIEHLVQAVPTALYIRHATATPDVFLNERLPLLLGYEAAELRAAHRMPLRALRHAADEPAAAAHQAALAAAPAGTVLETEFRLQTRQGEWKWFRAVETVFARDAQGQVRQVLGSAEDISERHAAAETLAQQQQFYETLLKSLPADIAVFDPNHQVLANFREPTEQPLTASWVGHSESDYSRHVGLPAELRKRQREKFRKSLKRKALVRWEESRPLPAGPQDFCLLRYYQPVLNDEGTVQFVIGYSLDISQLKRTEKLLENQREFVRQVIDNSPNPVLVLDGHGEVMLANAAFTELPVAVPASPAGTATGTATVGQAWRYEEMRELPNGQALWFQTMQKSFNGPDGSNYHLFISTDITALKQAGAAAQELARARQLFVATTSHEIRTPLHGIMGLAQMLRKTPLTEAQADFVDLMLSSTQSLLVVLNDILDYAKAEAGRLELESIPFDAGRTVQEAADLLGFKAAEKGLLLSVDQGAAAGLVVEGDPHRLRQVLVNLIGNAIKFTPQGRVQVAVDDVAVHGDQTRIRFSVLDTGIGIRADQFDTLFESFRQATSSTTRLYGGTGLGLSISRNLVQLQGGEIGVESREGLGSHFHFSIPYRTSARAAALAAPADPDASALRGQRVLLAEDNPINQLIALTVLTAWEVTVDVVNNGAEALQRATDTAYDLILMDLQMPVMGGLEATAQLRHAAGPNQHVPIVALTANGMKDDVAQYAAAGFTAYLIKPFLEADLYKVLAPLVAPRAPGRPANQELPAAPNPAPPRTTPPTAAAPATGRPPYDFTGLGKLAHNLQFVAQMQQLFVDRTPGQLAELETALAARDYATVRTVAHALKSTFGSLGMQPGTACLAEMEQLAAGTPDAARLAGLLRDVAANAATVTALFRKELARLV